MSFVHRAPRAVLMQHHAQQRFALPFAAMGTAALGLGHHRLLLQRETHKVVRAPSPLGLVLRIKMFHRPAPVPAPVLRDQGHDLIDRGAPMRHRPEALIDQALDPVELVASALPSKLPFAHPQQLGRLALREPALRPPFINVLKAPALSAHTGMILRSGVDRAFGERYAAAKRPSSSSRAQQTGTVVAVLSASGTAP